MIEVLVAIGLLGIIASSFFHFIWNQLTLSDVAGQSIQALSLTQEGLDAVNAIRDSEWTDITSATGTHGLVQDPTTGTWSFTTSTSDTTDGYTRTVTVTPVPGSPDERQIVVTVSWVDPSNKTETTTLTTIVSNWQENTVAASQTQTLLGGDWGHPQTLSELDIGLNIVGTGVISRNKIVYMSGTAGTASLNDFFVINATSSTHPTNIKAINTGPGLNALALSGNFAYVANNYSSNQLQVINISTPSNPYVITNKTLTGNTHAALSIAVTGTTALIGTALDNGPEFFVVDVSDPAIPVIKSSLKIKGNVNRISILGNRAFLATSSSTGEFIVVNISNPNVPVITKTVNLPGTNAAKGIYVNPQDSHAYVVRALASTAPSPEVNIFDVSSPDAPILIASKEISGNIYTAAAADNLLFLGTDVSNLGIQIYDISTLPTMKIYSSLNPLIVNDIAFENNLFYGSLQGPAEELVIFSSK